LHGVSGAGRAVRPLLGHAVIREKTKAKRARTAFARIGGVAGRAWRDFGQGLHRAAPATGAPAKKKGRDKLGLSPTGR